MPSIAIIIPCYNEAQRLQPKAFIEFGKANPDSRFFFVNDGSQDETATLLAKIKQQLPESHVVHLKKNSGKGEAVRQGLLIAINEDFPFAGYLDADLSTSLTEFQRLHLFASNQAADVVFGSRIKKLDSHIERSTARHLIGRGIATLIDKRFQLGIYDTQCGAKIFKSELLHPVLKDPFFTRWFFDVEIFLRIKKLAGPVAAFEVPLQQWTNVKNSKISLTSFPAVARELWTLSRNY